MIFSLFRKKVEADKWLSTNKDEEIKLIGQQSLLYSCTGRLLAVYCSDQTEKAKGRPPKKCKNFNLKEG